MRALLVVLVLWSGLAWADVRVVVVHDRAIPAALVRNLVRTASARIREDTGVRIRTVKVRAVKRLPTFEAYPYGAAPFYRDILKPTRPTVLLIPVWLNAGQAPICGDFVVSSVVPWAFGSLRYPREYFEGDVRTLTHELGHMLGASHTANGSVMDPGGSGARFSPSSEEEIAQCQSSKS